MQLAVVDLDGGLVGAALLAAAAAPGVPYTVTLLPNTMAAFSVHAAIEAGAYHASLIAMPGASTRLLEAAASPVAPYDATGAVEFTFDEGRGGSLLAATVRSASSELVTAASASVSRTLLSSAAAAGAAAAMLNPSALLAPVGSTTHNLHAVPYSGAHTATGLAFIDVYVVMLTTTNMQLRAFSAWDAAGVRRDHQYAFRNLYELAAALILSVWPPAVMAGLGGGLAPRVFFAWWAFCWLVMSAFGFCVTWFLANLGQANGCAARHSLVCAEAPDDATPRQQSGQHAVSHPQPCHVIGRHADRVDAALLRHRLWTAVL